jgi:hypothetical protein
VTSEQELALGVEEFNKMVGLRTEIRVGPLDLLEETWNSVKNIVRDSHST